MSRPDPKKFIIRVPATSANLGPGYDAIAVALQLYNECRVKIGGISGLKITVTGEGARNIPRDGSNLVFRACALACRYFKTEIPPLSLHQTNHIPLSRGLGSSAGAILTGLLLAKALTGKKFTEALLLQMGAELEGHADNLTAAYYGGIVVNYEADHKIQAAKFLPRLPLKVALAIPDLKIATADARSILPEVYAVKDVVANLRNLALLVHALHCGDYELLKPALRDALHQPYRSSLLPGFSEALYAAMKAGALGAALSGSGSTLIALCAKTPARIAQAMAHQFITQGIACRTLVTEISATGAEVLDDT